jgi:uncharacterized DUF497 family protein
MNITVKYELEGQVFEWSIVKYEKNVEKHGVTFEEAATVLIRTDTDIVVDDDNLDNEERFVALGFSEETRMLIVCYCEWSGGDIVRSISARKATKHERDSYKGGL